MTKSKRNLIRATSAATPKNRRAKTKPTRKSVAAFIAAIKDDERRADCKKLIKLMRKITGQPPVLWGPSIVGFDSYHYKYASGHEGNAALTGFSPRKQALTIYLLCGLEENKELLKKLGTYKSSVSCLYVKRLADIDLRILEALLKASIKSVRKKYPEKAKN